MPPWLLLMKAIRAYNGSEESMGLNCDAAAVTEPALMKGCLDRAITDFLALAG